VLGSDLAIQVAMSGSGQMQKNGPGRLILNATANSSAWSGGWLINQGTLMPDGNSTKTGSGTVVMENNTTFTTSTSSLIFNNPFTINGNVNFQTQANNSVVLTLGGTLSLGNATRTLNIGANSTNVVTRCRQHQHFPEH